MSKLFLILFSFFLLARGQAQMNTAGGWPNSVIEKDISIVRSLSMVNIAIGESGWFDNYVHAVTVDHNGRIWLAGQYGLAYSDDEGLTWNKNYSKYAVYEIFETQKHTLLASSNNSFVMRSEDNGKNWSTQKVFGKNGPTGRTSHGERYNDIFYLQINATTIIRTTQNSDKILISKNEGKTWKVEKVPDTPSKMFSLGDSLVIMFTNNEMFISRDECHSWTKEHAGLPTPKVEMYEVINEGMVMEDGFIMAYIDPYDPEKQEDYVRSAYTFDLKERKWKIYPEAENMAWHTSGFLDLKNGWMIISNYSHATSHYSYKVSLDKGKSWGTFNGDYESGSYIKDHFVNGNVIYMILGTSLVRMNIPDTCFSDMDKSVSVTDDFLISPTDKVIESDKVILFQSCAEVSDGYSRFTLYIPNDTTLHSMNIFRGDVDEYVDLKKRLENIELKKGSYEIKVGNTFPKGCYTLECDFGKNQIWSAAYFY